MPSAGAKQLCTVTSDLSGIPDSDLDPKRQSRGVFARGKKWFNCSYEVRANVGPADLTFELWYKGKKFSKNHAPIKVTWDDEGAASSPRRASEEVPKISQESGNTKSSSTGDSVAEGNSATLSVSK